MLWLISVLPLWPLWLNGGWCVAITRAFFCFALAMEGSVWPSQSS